MLTFTQKYTHKHSCINYRAGIRRILQKFASEVFVVAAALVPCLTPDNWSNWKCRLHQNLVF